MAKKIGVKLYLDGASQFNSDIRNCDNSLKQFQSELKRTSEEFRGNENSLEALSKKSDTLQKAYETSSKKVETYAKRLQELNKARDEEKAKATELQRSLEEEKKKLAEIEQTSGKSSEAYKNQAKAVADLEKELKTTEAAITRMDTQEVKLTTSLNNAATEQIRYGTELDKTNKYLEEAEKSSDGFAKSIDNTGKEIDETKGQGEKLGQTLEDLANIEAFEKISEGAKQALEAMAECVETAEKFEYAMAKVQSIAQVGADEYNKMSRGIREVSKEMGLSTGEVAEATYQAISASVDAGEAVDFVADATKLARAGFTETTSAVDVLTTAMNAYGKEANTTAHIADDLITTQNLGKTTVNELAQSLGTVIPTASALGVSLDQLSSMYVIMTKQGINTANATTYIRAMMNELSDAGSDVSEVFSNLTGYSFGEFISQGHTIADVLQVLGDSVNGNSEQFKNLFGNVRAGLGALSLFNQGTDAFNDAMFAMQNNVGATDKAFGIMADTAEMTNARLEASSENLKIAVGEALSPTVDKFKEAGIGILDAITNIVEENPMLVAAVAGAAGAVATAATAFVGLAMAVSLVRLAFGDVSAIAVISVAGIVAAAGALGGVAIAASSASDEVNGMTQSLKESAQEVQDLNKGTHEALKSYYSDSKHIDELVSTIDRLNNVENLNVYQRTELKNAVRDLNDALGEEVVSIDAETGHLTDNTGEWKKNAEAKKEALAKSGLEEQYNEVIQKRAEIEAQLWQVEDQINETNKEGAIILEDLSGKTGEVTTQNTNLTDSAKALYGQRMDLLTQSKQLAEDEDKLKTALEEVQAKTDEAAIAAGEYTDSLGVVHDSALKVAEAQDEIDSAVSKASEAIGNQIGLFDEWNAKSDLTLEKMEERWSGQTKGVNQYKDDLVYLKQVIEGETDPAIRDLASQMASMGVDGAAEIHNFVEGLKQIGDNKDKVKELAQTWQEHIDAISQAEGIYESIILQEKGYTEQSQAAFDLFYQDSEKKREEYNGNLVTLTEQGIKDQTKAVEDNAPDLQDATEQMMDTAFEKACTAIGMPTTGGTATKFSQMGTDIVDSIVEGMNGGDAKIGNALGNLLQKATDNISVSGVASRINQKLGEQINREAGR